MIAKSVEALEAVYTPMCDDPAEAEDRWGKRTVQYIINKKRDLIKKIRSTAKAMRKNTPQDFDVDDMYSMLLEYFLKCADYDPTYEGRMEEVVSFDSYIMSGIRNCIRRFYSGDSQTVSLNTVVGENDGGNGVTELGDLIPDEGSEEDFNAIGRDLDTSLRNCRYLRGKLGVDMYTLLYISLRTSENDELKQEILGILGCTKSIVSNFVAEASNPESDLHDLIQAIVHESSVHGAKATLDKIRAYVPDADRIDAAIDG